MPQSDYRIYPDRALAVVWLSGTVTQKVLSDRLVRLYTDPEWKEGYGTLWHCKKVTRLILDPLDIDRLMESLAHLRSRRGTGNLAFVVARPQDWDFFYFFIHREESINRPAKVFWKTGEALEWMQIDNPPAELFADEKD